MIFKHLKWKDYLIIGLIFVVTATTILLTTIDETPYESTAPYFIGLLALLGFILMMPVNLPLIFLIHVVNFFGQCQLRDDVNGNCFYKNLIIPYDWYFAVLPWVCAFVYSLIVAIFLNEYNKKEK